MKALIRIHTDYNLTKLNTLGVPARARLFAIIHSEEEIKELSELPEFKENKKMFLGGGSNVLFTTDFDGIVILNQLRGISILDEDDKSITLRSMSGVVWHELVSFSVERELWGIENLSLIPGTVGGAPVQNIGAYGAELKDVLENVEAYDIETGAKKIFTTKECEFGYRDSVFKNRLKGKYFISAITLKLSKVENKNLSYKILSKFLEDNKIEVKSPRDISDAVVSIRRSKLPDPAVIGNAGSFFKNVFVAKEKLEELLKKFPDLHYFEEGKENKIIKISSAWLIEQCGPADGTSWKGHRVGNAGVHDKQALVLVNHGGATGQEIKNLAEQIIASVYEKFGLKLVPEVNLVQ